MKDLYKHVTPCYAAQWEDIGVYLDIELGHLKTIKADHPGDTSGCCKDLWKKWLELDPNATWEKLFTAIDDCTAASSSTATGTYYYIWYCELVYQIMKISRSHDPDYNDIVTTMCVL